MTKLPQGWQQSRLDGVADVVNGFGFPNYLQGQTDLPYPFIKVSDMNAEGAEVIVESAVNTANDEILTTIGARVYPANTIIFPKVGGALLTNKKRILGVSATFDNNVMGVVPKAVDPKWLYYWFQTIDLGSLANTQALPSIRQSSVAALEVPLPPLDEQRRIVAILNEKMAAIDRARAAAQAQLKAAQSLPAAYLRQVFNGEESQGWPRRPFGEVCKIISPQVDPTLPEYRDLPHVSGENIESSTGRLKYLNTAAEDGMTSGKYLFDPGDVLYSKLRPYLRKVTQVDFKGLCSADMYPLKVNPDLLDSSFTVWMLLSKDFTDYANEESQRSRMPKLNREQLFSWSAPLPELSQQRNFTAYLNTKMERVEETVKKLNSQLDTINALPSALLRQAFAGEL